MKRILLLQLVVTICLSVSIPLGAANYYLSPSGDDSRSGLSTTLAWATLAKAKTIMAAGDTLFIMGGTYTNAQKFWCESGEPGGTVGQPMVFKAYGDSKAIFQSTGNSGRQTNRYWYFYPGQDWVVIDGFSHLNPSDSLYIKLEGREDASYVIRFEGTASNRSEHIKIRGIEIDGNFPPPGATYLEGGLMRYAVGFTYGAMDTIESCYLHHVYHATGDIPPGDGTDRAQGTGETIFLMSCERVLVWKNTLGNANHAAMSVGKASDSASPSRYIKTMYNKCENYWGGGLYYANATEYSLFEGNVVTHCGETTTKTKGPLYFAGPNNVARKNVTYTPHTDGMDASGGGFGGTCMIVDSTLVYNNTFFNCAGNSLKLLVNNTNGSFSCVDASCRDGIYANNIFYKSTGMTPDVNRAAEIKLWLYDANEENNWIDPDVAGTLPSSTHFGGNKFYNNVIRKDGHDETWNQAIVYAQQPSMGSTLTWSIAQIQALDPSAWFNNIGLDPLLVNEFPDAYGQFNGWWALRAGSPCIDRGAQVNDYIGAYVNSLYPGYGWGNLTYRDAAPDIGAYEVNGENPSPLSNPIQHRLGPGPR